MFIFVCSFYVHDFIQILVLHAFSVLYDSVVIHCGLAGLIGYQALVKALIGAEVAYQLVKGPV